MNKSTIENYKELTIQTYNNNIKEISEKYKHNTDSIIIPFIEKFLSLIPGKKILDVGCGSGEHIQYFLKKEYIAEGIDLSDEMIKICKEKNLNVKKMDIENINYKKNSFDGIWASTSLLHIPKEKMSKFSEKAYEILNNNGIIYISLKEGTNENIIKYKNTNNYRFFAYWKKEELEKIFEDKFKTIHSKINKHNNENYIILYLKKL